MNRITRSVRDHPELWAVGAITALALVLRFSTLGLQAYRHDEAITAGRVLEPSLFDTMRQVWDSESTPPLYYALAWAWTRVFGIEEMGLRSISALAGTATITVGYLIGREFGGRRTGLALAALLAVNPMLIWYSQDARAYSLVSLLGALALLFAIRAGLRGGGARDLAGWAIASALALTAHYFAVFPLVLEAGWLLWRVGDRRNVLIAIAGVIAVALALSPIAIHQAESSRNDWIGTGLLATRLKTTGVTFLVGEIGAFIGEPLRGEYAIVPATLAISAGLLVVWKGGQRHRRAAALGLGIGGGAVVLSVALKVFGQDYVLARNLLPSLVPLAIVVAAGMTIPKARAIGLGVGVGLLAYLLAFDLYVNFQSNLQRPDWRGAIERLGPPTEPRLISSAVLAGAPLELYAHRLYGSAAHVDQVSTPKYVREIDFVASSPVQKPLRLNVPPQFREIGRFRFGRMTVIRFRTGRGQEVDPRPLSRRFDPYLNAPEGVFLYWQKPAS